MSTRQLQSHLNRLNTFTSRGTSYVAGLKGTPLSGGMWREYKRAERAYNAKSNSFYDSVKDLVIPTINQTVSKYVADLRDSRRDGDYRSFGTLERTAAGITGDAALKSLLKQMEGRAASDYLAKEATLQRRILRKMLERTSNKDLAKLINKRDENGNHVISDEEIITLQYTELMDTLKGSYAMAKSTSTDTPRWQSDVYEDNEETINDLIEWAHRHFSDKKESEQDTDGPRKPTRDKYGRFVRADQPNPEPQFPRDERGRFAPRS